MLLREVSLLPSSQYVPYVQAYYNLILISVAQVSMGLQASAGGFYQHFVSILISALGWSMNILPVDTNLDSVTLVLALSFGAIKTTFPRISSLNCTTSVPLSTRSHWTFPVQLPRLSLNTSTFCILVLRDIVPLGWMIWRMQECWVVLWKRVDTTLSWVMFIAIAKLTLPN